MTLRSRRAATRRAQVRAAPDSSLDVESRLTWTFPAQSPSFAGAARRFAAHSP